MSCIKKVLCVDTIFSSLEMYKIYTITLDEYISYNKMSQLIIIEEIGLLYNKNRFIELTDKQLDIYRLLYEK